MLLLESEPLAVVVMVITGILLLVWIWHQASVIAEKFHAWGGKSFAGLPILFGRIWMRMFINIGNYLLIAPHGAIPAGMQVFKKFTVIQYFNTKRGKLDPLFFGQGISFTKQIGYHVRFQSHASYY